MCMCIYVAGGSGGLPELLSGLHHHKVPGVVDPLVQYTVPLLKNTRTGQGMIYDLRGENFSKVIQTYCRYLKLHAE